MTESKGFQIKYPMQIKGRAVSFQIPKETGEWYTWNAGNRQIDLKLAVKHCEALYKKSKNNLKE